MTTPTVSSGTSPQNFLLNQPPQSNESFENKAVSDLAHCIICKYSRDHLQPLIHTNTSVVCDRNSKICNTCVDSSDKPIVVECSSCSGPLNIGFLQQRIIIPTPTVLITPVDLGNPFPADQVNLNQQDNVERTSCKALSILACFCVAACTAILVTTYYTSPHT